MLSAPRVLAVVAGTPEVATPDNFRSSLWPTVADAVDYVTEAGIPVSYWAVALIEGLLKRRRTGRRRPPGRLSLAEEPLPRAYRRRRKPWAELSPATRRRYLASGRDHGWSDAQTRTYYRSGRQLLGVLRPNEQALFHEPGAWQQYIARNQTRLSNRYGEETARGLLAAGAFQRIQWAAIPGRTPSADIALYIAPGTKKRK